MDRFLSFEPHIDQLVAKCTGVLVSLIYSEHILLSFEVWLKNNGTGRPTDMVEDPRASETRNINM